MSHVRSRWAAVGAAVAVTLGAGGLFTAQAATPSTSVFVPVAETRVLDTRPGADIGPTGPVVSGTSRNLALTGVIATGSGDRQVIPAGATAAVYNVTVVEPTAPGYVAVRSGDASGTPSTSSINFDAGVTIANGGTVTLPTNGTNAGSIDIFHDGATPGATTDIVIDITGYYIPGSSAAGAKGDPGIQGEPGAKGEPGPKGAQGVPGVGDLGCTTDQTISWDDVEGSWMCATPVADTDTLASLDCTINQTIGFNGEAWECRSAPITASLTRSPFSPECCGIDEVFTAYSPNIDTSPDYICDALDFLFCDIHLVDVVDHTSCQANVSNPDIDVDLYTDHVFLLGPLDDTETLYVNISCSPNAAPSPR